MSFNFKKDAESVSSSEIYYDLFEGGYLRPERFLEDPYQVQKVNDAVSTIEQYLHQLMSAELLDVM